MTEHEWAKKQIAAFLSDKLTSEDVERLEAHARDCAQCEQAVAAVRAGKGLKRLFAEVRPDAELEERMARAFRAAPRPARFSRPLRKAIAIIAAILLLGTYGGIATNGLFDAESWRSRSAGSDNIAARQPSGRHQVKTKTDPTSLINEGPGLQSNLESALPEIERVDKATVDAAITRDNLGQPGSPGFSKTGDFVMTHQSSAFGAGTPGGIPGGGMMGMGGGMMGIGGGIAGGGQGGGFGPSPATNGTGYYYNGTIPGFNFNTTAPPLGGYPNTSPPTTLPVSPQSMSPPATSQPANFEPGKFRNALPPYQPPGDDSKKDFKNPPQQVTEPKTPPASKEPKDPAAMISPDPTRRIIIRSGDIEFEIVSFDTATATVTKLITAIPGAFIATVNSEKLPNGKVRGSITIRTPPEHLDSLVLDLRKELGKGGELKGIRISSQDVTKQYTDLESRLRGARTMEQRLIQIIKEGKGEIKQLLEAERELGVWRTKIEEFEGEIRYFASLAALSTLNITLNEKEARAEPVVTESERVQAGVEVEDVDKAYQQLLAAVLEAKGRVSKSELKQFAAGQFNATLHFEVAPDASGPMRDRLRQLGRVARLEIDRGQRTEGGTAALDTKPKRGDTVFLVQIYNLANIAAKETVIFQLAAADVAVAYQTLRAAVAKEMGRVVAAQLNEQDKQNVTAQLDFEVRRANEGPVRLAIEKAGELISQQATQAPESDSVTETKVLLRVSLIANSRVRPRETKILQLAAPDVSVAYRTLRDVVAKNSGRIVSAQLNEQDRQNVTAVFAFEVRKTDADAVEAALSSAGEVISLQVSRAPESELASDSKLLYQMTFSPTSKLKPRETSTLTIEVGNVDQMVGMFNMQVAEKNGRVLASQTNRESSGRTTAKLGYELPLASAASVVQQFKSEGNVHVSQTTQDPQAPNGKFATAKLEVTLTNAEAIVAADDGLWPQVRRGLTNSLSALLKSVSYVVFGLFAVLPWAVIGFLGYRVIRQTVRPTPSAAAPATSTAPPTVAST